MFWYHLQVSLEGVVLTTNLYSFMNNIELHVGYSNKKDDELIPFCEGVVLGVENNPNFNVSKEVITDLRTAMNLYRVALGKSKNGSPLDTMNKNEAKDAVVLILNGLALNLCLQADGDRTKLATTGFDLVKEHERKKQPPKPTGFTFSYGNNPGTVILSVDVCKDSRIYLFYYTSDINADPTPASWTTIASTVRKVTIEGLTRGVEYRMCCAYQGTDNKPIFGNVLNIMAI